MSLLCPIARALSTTVDELLQFENTLSDQAVGEKIGELVALARQAGANAAEDALRALLRQYPHCAPLQLNGAMFYDYLQMASADASEADKARWRDEKQALLRAAWTSGGAYRQAAAHMLAAWRFKRASYKRRSNTSPKCPISWATRRYCAQAFISRKTSLPTRWGYYRSGYFRWYSRRKLDLTSGRARPITARSMPGAGDQPNRVCAGAGVLPNVRRGAKRGDAPGSAPTGGAGR